MFLCVVWPRKGGSRVPCGVETGDGGRHHLERPKEGRRRPVVEGRGEKRAGGVAGAAAGDRPVGEQGGEAEANDDGRDRCRTRGRGEVDSEAAADTGLEVMARDREGS